METQFSRELDGSYLIMSDDSGGDVFSARMTEEQKPAGLLALKARYIGERTELRYDISGLKSMESIYQTREMEAAEIRDLICSIYRVSHDLEEYLLSPDRLWLDPGLIYRGKNGWSFCLCPLREKEFYEQLEALSRYILKKCNHEDKSCADMAYGLFQVCSEDNYSFSQIWEVLQTDGDDDPPAETSAVQPEPPAKTGWLKRLFAGT